MWLLFISTQQSLYNASRTVSLVPVNCIHLFFGVFHARGKDTLHQLSIDHLHGSLATVEGNENRQPILGIRLIEITGDLDVNTRENLGIILIILGIFINHPINKTIFNLISLLIISIALRIIVGFITLIGIGCVDNRPHAVRFCDLFLIIVIIPGIVGDGLLSEKFREGLRAHTFRLSHGRAANFAVLIILVRRFLFRFIIRRPFRVDEYGYRMIFGRVPAPLGGRSLILIITIVRFGVRFAAHRGKFLLAPLLPVFRMDTIGHRVYHFTFTLLIFRSNFEWEKFHSTPAAYNGTEIRVISQKTTTSYNLMLLFIISHSLLAPDLFLDILKGVQIRCINKTPITVTVDTIIEVIVSW